MKIIIAGYGAEGRSNYAYFRRVYPQAELTIADMRPVVDAPDGATVLTGQNVFAQLPEADMVVRTAGLAPRLIQTDGTVWSATNEFFARCPAPIIGVTGTKGKGTTCSFITEMLRAAGQTAHLVGNIGVPALDVLEQVQPNDVVVYELSSFQLWDAERSPHIAVVLMIEPDHLDVHQDMAEYVAAKANITVHQTANDTVVYAEHNSYSRAVAEASLGQTIAFPRPLTDRQQQALKLPGAHNRENASAAIAAVRAFLPDITEEAICQGLAAFTGLPHRLKYVAEVGGVRLYDDSISTTPGSAIAAMRSFTEPKVLILGGHDKGADYTQLAQETARSPSLRAVLLSGANAQRIAAALRDAGVDMTKVQHQPGTLTMPEVVTQAMDLAHPGDVVILSPAAASFDQYASYTDRGEQFVAAVRQLTAS